MALLTKVHFIGSQTRRDDLSRNLIIAKNAENKFEDKEEGVNKYMKYQYREASKLNHE